MKRRASNDRSLFLLVIVTFVFGGGSLIALIYGPTALLTAMPILVLGAALIGLLWWVITAVAGRIQRQEQADHEAAARHIARRHDAACKDETDSSGR